MQEYPDITKNFCRYRIRNPNLFDPDSYATIDIGETGKHKLVRAKLKKTGEYKTQSVIVEKKYANNKEIKKETNEIIKKERAE